MGISQNFREYRVVPCTNLDYDNKNPTSDNSTRLICLVNGFVVITINQEL